MAIETHYLFTASMDVDPDKEDLFNEVYDTEHIPNLYQVPGLISVTRLVNQPFTMAIGGELRSVEPGNEPRYSAVYEIESPEVIASPRVGNSSRRRSLAHRGPPLHPQPTTSITEGD